MLIPPAWVYLRFGRGPGLWLPVFLLLWPLGLLGGVIFLVLGPPVALLIGRPRLAWAIVRGVFYLTAAFWSLHGLNVAVAEKGQRFSFRVY